MSWPLSQDYNEAIQSPASNFTDADLRRGEAVANALGIPMPYSAAIPRIGRRLTAAILATRPSRNRTLPP